MKFLVFCAVTSLVAASAVASSLADKGVRQVQVASMDAAVDLGATSDLSYKSPHNIDHEVDRLVAQAIALLRHIIKNGYPKHDIPTLDPLFLKEFQFDLPAGLINMGLALQNAHLTGLGDFVVHESKLNIRELTLDLDLTFPRIYVTAGLYDFVGDLFTVIPLYGKGVAVFIVEGLRIKGLVHLKRSKDGKSVLIDHVENPGFELHNFESHLTGVIGGGDIDAIVNTLIDDVVVEYVRRFPGALTAALAPRAVALLNPVLERLDTWHYIKNFL